MKIWRAFWTHWKSLALKIARAQTLFLLTLFYFTLFGFYALVLKLFQRDLLDKKWRKEKSFWIKKERVDTALESAKRQF